MEPRPFGNQPNQDAVFEWSHLWISPFEETALRKQVGLEASAFGPTWSLIRTGPPSLIA